MTSRTALVTGGSRGIGAAIVHRLRSDDMDVLAPSREELDLSSIPSIDNYVRQLQTPVDVLVNCAGINQVEACVDITPSSIQDTLQVNLVAPILLTRSFMPQMALRRYGRIVNISSIWSVVSKSGRTVYSSSKSGLNGMTRTLAIEGAPSNVLVNAVAPGFVNTKLTRQNNTEQEIEAIRQTIPACRLAEPNEIAEVVAFLCSERNTYIVGQTILVDGGFTCQ